MHCKIATVKAVHAAQHIRYVFFFFWQRHKQNLSERDQAITDLAKEYDFRGTGTIVLHTYTGKPWDNGTSFQSANLRMVMGCKKLNNELEFMQND